MKYEFVLFDLDGTLMDTSAGIIHSYQTTLEKFEYDYSHLSDFLSLIGGSIPENLSECFHVKQQDIRSMVNYYREVYQKEGIYQGEVYDGTVDLLSILQQEGCTLGIATLKREDFAISMMRKFQLYPYFDCICGMDQYDTKSKTDIIKECQKKFRIHNEKTIMIGDTSGDEQAAQECDIDFMAVTYGFGFKKEKISKNNFSADSTREILEYLRCT